MQQVIHEIPDTKSHEGNIWQSRDEEMRKLRINFDIIERAWKKQKSKNGQLEKENQRLRDTLRDAEQRHKKEQSELQNQLDKVRKERDTYKSLLFKSNSTSSKEDQIKVHFIETKLKRKRGGQAGHKGKGFQKPDHIDEKKRVYLSHCPHCESQINRSNAIDRHTVIDIPKFELIRYMTTEFEIEKQWCGHCKREVKAKPVEILPQRHYGIHILLYVMMEKYGAKTSYSAIRFSLEKLFGLKIAEGTLVNMLKQAGKWLGEDYDRILNEIRVAKVKHADETSWRIQGINHWIWGLFTQNRAYYCVDQSRGKGVIDDLMQASNPDSVLIRDDYAAYKKLNFAHQSCWAHLLRKSHDASTDPKASKEVQILHRRLKRIFDELTTILASPFLIAKRQKAHLKYEAIFQQIIQARYKSNDTKQIQTRISNQGNNLITALIYEDVPLTNNLAERSLRPLVVTRKISQGSQSPEGAKTHMVNMSVFQSILLQGKDLLPSLKSAILAPAI